MADAKALVAVLEAENNIEALQSALDGITAHLEPLLELRDSGQLSMDALRPVARTHGPIVTALIKHIGGRLSPNQNYSHEQLVLFGEATSLALNAVDVLRPVLKASGHELDVQRYNFVRKLAAYRLYEHAMEQGKVLLASVAASPGTVTGPGELHIAAVANVLVCYSELVKQGASRAEMLWRDIHGPLDDLLRLAREAADPAEAAKRLDLVMKCLGKVASTWQYASVVCNLTPVAVAQQLSALTACAVLCGQERMIQQVLVDDAATAPDTVKLAMMNSLIYILAADGSLPDPLLPMLHLLVVSLVEKRAGPLLPPTGLPSSQPLVVLLHAAFQLQHCPLTNVPDEQLCDLLQKLSAAVEDLAITSRNSSHHEHRLRWCCLDGLRVSVAGILTQLLSAPQCAGGHLGALLMCMELLSDSSLRMISEGGAPDADAAAPSGSSAVTIIVRLQVAHALCTGQLSSLRDGVSRSMGLLKGLLDSSRERALRVASCGIGPAALYNLSACLVNSGLDLLQAQHAAPAAVLLQAAADLALERARSLRKQGSNFPDTDMAQLIKKCKTHVTALQQLHAHEVAMSSAASYVAQLHALADGRAHLLWSISKQFVQSSLAAYDASVATAVAAVPPVPAVPGDGPAAVPAAPCKANRRGGRMQRMQANAQSQASQATEAPQRAGKQSSESRESATGVRPALSSVVVAPPRTLVQLLAAAALEKRGWPALLESLDLYAVQELEVVREEVKRREDDNLQSLYCAAVLDTLSKCARVAESSDTQRARELLVKAVTFSATLDDQISDLRATCELLGTLLVELPEPPCALSAAELGVLDSAATAHAHLGLCLAQKQLTARGFADDGSGSGHIEQAITLWRRLLAAHAANSSTLIFRMPQATLHAALQVQQFLHLHADVPSEALGFSLDIVWRLMRELSFQVKIREQQAYLLSVTMPSTTCTAWVIACQPLVPLAEAFTDAQQHRKLAEILKVTEPVRNLYTFSATDHIAVATAAGACAAEMERSGFLRHGPAPMLLRSQCHQVAAAAYLRAGDTVNAYVHVQEALRITCALMANLDCPPISLSGAAAGDSAPSSSTSSGAAKEREMTPAEAAAAAVKSGAATSALDYAGDGLTGDLGAGAGCQSLGRSGNGDEAAGSKLRSGRVLSACLAWATAAAHLASLHGAARVFEAAGCVEDATFMWGECLRAAELFHVTGVRFLCRNYLAEMSCRRGDVEAAATHLKAAGAAIQREIGTRNSVLGVETALLNAHSCAVRARLALLRQQHQQVQDAAQEGVAACSPALDSMSLEQPGCGGPNGFVIPERQGALLWHGPCLFAHLHRLQAEALSQIGRRKEAGQLLQSALARLQQAAAACSTRSAAEIWPVDYGLVLAHHAAVTSAPAAPSCRSAFLVGLGSFGAGSCGGKETSAQSCAGVASDTTDMSPSSDQSSKKGNKSKFNNSSPCKSETLYPHRQGQQTDVVPSGVVDVLGTVPALLQSLRLCWQLPLAAVYACRQLLHASIALGLPYAAMMFLHLGHGVSYAQQQALQREWRRCATNGTMHSSGAQKGQDAEDAVDTAAGSSSLEQGSGLATNVHEAALAVLLGLDLGGDAGTIESLASLESGAKAWLLRALDVLPVDAVISSIVQDDEGGQMLVGRVARGGAPLLAVLRGPDADASGQQPAERHAAGTSAGRVLDRCTARLRQLLDESGDSMHIDQDAASSQNHKAKWWKTRVSLDNSVRGLLQDIDEQCLGPWRCFMLPVPTAHLAIWREAAEAFMGEHLSSALAEHPCSRVHSRVGVLRELLTVALSGMRHLQTGDADALLDVVCNQLGLSGGASRLAVELAAAEAAARVQILRFPCVEQGTGAEPRSGKDGRHEDVPPAAVAASRPAAASRTVAVGRSTAGATTRTRPGAAAGQALSAPLTSKSGLREVGRRTGAASSCEAAEPMDAENLPPQPTVAADAAGRARRTTRTTATQPDAASSQAAAPKAGARMPSTRLATRNRTATAVIAEDQPGAEHKKADASRGVSSSYVASESGSSTRSDRVAEVRGLVQRDAGPVMLVLSPALHALPWESIPCCHGKEVYRILSLPVACAAAVTAAGNVSTVTNASESCGSPDVSENAGGSCGPCLASRPSAFYVLNPNGDLVDTQRCFQPILEAQAVWEGITGQRPTVEALLAALQTRDLFLYFGHGSGEQFLPLPALRKLQRCATCLLMGCSSGRLRLHGAYDPSGAAVAYLLAGCPALVANLWDVTDRDIDRYCQALMHAWLGCEVPQSAGESSSCTSGSACGSKPDQPGSTSPGSESLGLAVARSRSACKLTYLIGAAPVCYGLPRRYEAR